MPEGTVVRELCDKLSVFSFERPTNDVEEMLASDEYVIVLAALV